MPDVAGTVFCADGNYFQTIGISAVNLSASPPSLQSSQGSFLGIHNGGANAAFLDGHVKWMSISNLAQRDASNTYYRHFTKTAD
ncbi:MAG: hypothetical protein GW893_10870 [Armatimonadetes bacterium]|nr:hypothetical protein [Armatimonadota bacterium]PIU61903.1 MAG: hypothetical protein COS85_20020 [Armatimonadetes bacterium CG07_land_8_20_14_0_80_59_28]PIX40785.1 MAG: hypothetical protein COZ56_13845 [Armatimonadetes bacterium CG_4_8_14_3_um_filter_58_9]